jgi:DNA repair exonuclease SbcCD ATPase subunit
MVVFYHQIARSPPRAQDATKCSEGGVCALTSRHSGRREFVPFSSKEEISKHEQRRSQIIEERTAAVSRAQFLTEQLKRLRLLALYYKTDSDRLRAVVEASRVYHELPEGTCPLCDRPYAVAEQNGSPHQQFEKSCVKEIQKIDVLQADLHESIQDFTREVAELRTQELRLNAELITINDQLFKILSPDNRSARQNCKHSFRSV